jgi:hypothetical protein
MDELRAVFLAYILFAVMFLPAFKFRAYYLAFCVVLLLGGGAEFLIYAPALWALTDLGLFVHKEIFA